MKIRSTVKDRTTGEMVPLWSHETLLVLNTGEAHMTPAFLVEWVHRCVVEHVRHEIDECFLVAGQRLYDPHEKYEALMGPTKSWRVAYPADFS